MYHLLSEKFDKIIILFLVNGIPLLINLMQLALCELKGVFAKNERGYRLNAIKKRF